MRVAIVVLGDVGRSPRMQYHAVALTRSGADVDLLGYAGTPTCMALRDAPRLHCHLFSPQLARAPEHLSRPLFVVYAALRVLLQGVQLLWRLCTLPKPDILLVQNPPAIPTLALAYLASRLRGAKLIIDWHNFGCSMLALRLGPDALAVRLARWYERTLGRRAHGHLCVSAAMRAELTEEWGIAARVLYDRPAEGFVPTPLPARREVFARLADVVRPATGPYDPDSPTRPGLVVTATSWTVDEDFDLLLDALERYEALHELPARAALPRLHPHLLIVITGKGPLRASYEARIRTLSLRTVSICTAWLSPEDYPLVLGSADLGLCLHRSASGVDLPMKIADMLGAGLPVCALNYGPCIAEQLRDGENGLVFSTAEQLAGLLSDLFQGFPHETHRLDRLRHAAAAHRPVGWVDGWVTEALPLFRHLHPVDSRP